MTATNLVVTVDRSALQSVGVRGQAVISSHQQLKRLLQARLSDQHALLFAEPVVGSNTISWYTEEAGQPVPFSAIPEPDRPAANQRLEALVGDVKKLAAELQASPDIAQQIVGETVEAALHYASDDYLHLVGSQPVIACWGMKRGDALAASQELSRQSLSDAETPRGEILSRPGLAPKPAKPWEVLRTGTSDSFRRWRGILWWLLWGAVALLLLLGLRTCGSSRFWTPPFGFGSNAGARNEESHAAPEAQETVEDALDRERRREDILRQELSRLQLSLIERRQHCVESTPSPVPIPPNPPSVPDPIPPEPPPPDPAPPPRDPVEKQLLPPAELSKERWKERDLSMFKGCWNLSRQGPAQQYDPAGNVTDRGITRSARICFDAAGHGRRTAEQSFQWGRLKCSAPIRARFDPQGRLVSQQPAVQCTGTRASTWLARTLTCTRRNDSIADCVDRNVYGEYRFEFRRAP